MNRLTKFQAKALLLNLLLVVQACNSNLALKTTFVTSSATSSKPEDTAATDSNSNDPLTDSTDNSNPTPRSTTSKSDNSDANQGGASSTTNPLNPSPPASSPAQFEAKLDQFGTIVNLPTTIDLFANDIIGAGENPILSTTFPLTTTNGGTVTLVSNGVVSYTPASGYQGPDSFTYSMTSQSGQISNASVQINVVTTSNASPSLDGSMSLWYGFTPFANPAEPPSILKQKLTPGSNTTADQRMLSAHPNSLVGGGGVYQPIIRQSLGRYGGYSFPISSSKIFYFGGFATSVSNKSTDMWEFDLTNQSLAQVMEDNLNGTGTIGTTIPDFPNNGGASVTICPGATPLVYIFGGSFGPVLGSDFRNELWEFNPQTRAFRKVYANTNAGTGIDPAGRMGSAIACHNNRIVVIGGYRWENLATWYYYNDVWAYDLTGNSWQKIKGQNNDGIGVQGTAYPEARWGMTYNLIGNKLYMFGGERSTNGKANDIWSFDFSTGINSFTRELDLNNAPTGGTVGIDYPAPRSSSLGFNDANKIYFLGGATATTSYNHDVWAFDTVAKTFSRYFDNDGGGVGQAGVDFPTRRNGPMVSMMGNSLYLFAGADPSDTNNVFPTRSDLWRFNLNTKTWTKVLNDYWDRLGRPNAALPDYRRSQSVVAGENGQLYMFGGFYAIAPTKAWNDVWAFDTVNGKYLKLTGKDNDGVGVVDTDFPKGRYESVAGYYNGKIYLYGGTDTTGVDRNDVWQYDITTKTFVKLIGDNNNGSGSVGIDYPNARSAAGGVYTNGKLYFMGGTYAAASHNDFWSFDVVTKTFTRLMADNNGGSGTAGVNFPEAANNMMMTTDGNGKIYIWAPYGSLENKIWSYDINLNTFTLLSDTAARLAGGQVMNTDFPRQRILSSIVYLNQKIYIAGGGYSTSSRLNDVWSYDLQSNAFTKIMAQTTSGAGYGKEFPVTSRYPNLVEMDGRIFWVGGAYTSTTNMMGHVWEIIPEPKRADDRAETMMEFDLSSQWSLMEPNAPVILDYTGYALGDNSGVTTAGLDLLAWNSSMGQYDVINRTTETTTNGTIFSVALHPRYIDTNTKKIQILFRAQYPQSPTVTTKMDFGFRHFRLQIPQNPNISY